MTGGGEVGNFRLLWRVIKAFLLAALLLYAAHLAYHAYNLARARGEVNYAETTWLFAAIRVRHGLTPYFDYSHAPYIPMVYPPLLPELSGGLAALFSLGDSQVITLTRLISLASVFSISTIIASMCRILGVSRLLSVMAGLLFLTPQVTFSVWSANARSDLLAVALGQAAVLVLLFASRKTQITPWFLALSGLLCGLALSAKQTAVAPLLATGLWLIWTRSLGNRTQRIGRIALLCLFALAGFAALLLPFGLDGAKQLLQGTLDLASQPQMDANFYTRLDNLVTMFGLLFPLSAFGVWVLVRSKGGATHPAISTSTAKLLLLYGTFSAIVLLVTAAKIGSASSYCLETIAVLCTAAGVGLGALEKLIEGAERQLAMALLILAIAPIATQTWYAVKTAQSSQDKGPDDGPLAALAQVTKGPVLSENGYILLNGTEPPYLLDPLFFSVQAHNGKWDPQPVVMMAEQRKFVAVVLFHTLELAPSVNGIPWLPSGLYGAIKNNYTLAGAQGRYYVYLPKSP